MERIEGLSIALDLDTLRLDRGLTGLKDKLRTVNSEMKSNMSAFDRGDKSIEKYETRIQGLNKKLDVQKQVTKEARAEYEKMVSEHGGGSKEAEKAAREYNNQAAALNNLERYIERAKKELVEFKKEQAISNSNWTKAGNGLIDFGDKLGKISTKFKDTGKELTKRITMPAVAAVSALGGIALVKGFGRLIGIDTARAKLVGLGHDAEGVEKIMSSALDAVRGTSFGMDEAATTAANAVAAGVKEGKELTKYLSLTGDAAAIAGSSMSEMGSVLNKVKTSNKAYNGELQQLSDRGLPVYQWLAKEAGVAADEVTNLASDGKISSEMLMKAIENNIGGAAQKMGEESFTAGLANMWAAVGRLGASFLDAGGKGGGFFSQLKPLISDFTGRIDTMGDFAEKAGVKFGELFTGFIDKVKSVKSAYDDLSPTVQDIIKKVGIVGSIGAVSLGPMLVVFGTLGGIVAKAANGLGDFFKLIGKNKALKSFAGNAGEGAKKVGLLSRVFGLLSGPVGWIISGISLLGTALTIAYKKSETFRNFVNKLKDAFVEAFKKVKEFLTTNESFLGFIDSVKNGFSTAKDLITQAFGAAMDFVKDKIAEIKKFWGKEGGGLLKSFQNIFSGIWKVAEPIINALVTAVQWAFPYIKKTIEVALKTAFSVVKMIWGNIKGVINGALDIIMGGIKIFSGLFTGDWGKMWDGIKQVTSGLVQFIWNFIQLSFFGKLIKGGLAFIKSFAGFFSTMWTGIRNIFSTVIKWIVDFVKNRFTAMSNTVNTIFTTIKNFISMIWNGILSFFKTIIKSIVDFVRGRFSALRDTITNIFIGIRNTASNIWNGIKNNVINPVKELATNAINRFRTFRDNVSAVFSKIKENVSGYVSDMVKNVKEMPGKMKDGIVEMAYKVYDGMKEVANKMAKGLGKGVNGVIGGVNWVLEKLHVEKKLPTWPVPEYAQGTGSHPGGLAVVGDGFGSNAGPELIRTPDGKVTLSPAKDTLVNLPKGTQVLPARLTKQLIPHYAFGTIWDKTKNIAREVGGAVKTGAQAVGRGVKKGAGAVKDFGVNVWDYAKNPGKLLNLALKTLGIETPSGATTLGKIAKGGFTTVKDNAVGFIKKKMDELLNFGGGPAPSGGASAWRPMILKAAARMGEAITNEELKGIIAQIQRESGGNQKIVQSSAVWDVNMAAGNPARGLLQYIPQTFNAYKMPGNGNIYSGYDQLLAFFNNRTWRRDLPYGKRGWGPRGGRKFATGGKIFKNGLYQLAEGGFPEWVIPTDPSRRTEAMKLLALAGKEISGNKRPHQLPNVGGSDSTGIQYLEKMVALLSEQVDDLKQVILLLTQLVANNPDSPVSDHQLKRFLSRLMDEGLGERAGKKRRAFGGA